MFLRACAPSGSRSNDRLLEISSLTEPECDASTLGKPLNARGDVYSIP
jgi:hypothetical protein